MPLALRVATDQDVEALQHLWMTEAAAGRAHAVWAGGMIASTIGRWKLAERDGVLVGAIRRAARLIRSSDGWILKVELCLGSDGQADEWLLASAIEEAREEACTVVQVGVNAAKQVLSKAWALNT